MKYTIVTMLTLAIVGCAYNPDAPQFEATIPDLMQLEDVEIQGESQPFREILLGSQGDVSVDASHVARSYMQTDIYGKLLGSITVPQANSGAIMGALDAQVHFSLFENLPEGTVVRTGENGLETIAADGTTTAIDGRISGRVCSGQRAGDWSSDEPADDVEIVVLSTETERVLSYTLTTEAGDVLVGQVALAAIISNH